MSTATLTPELDRLPVGGHESWTVEDGETYVIGVERLLGLAQRRNEKAVLFGPERTTPPPGLTRRPAAWADPRTSFLDGGPLVPEVMFSVFGQQVELARREGYSGLMVVADMDWLLPLGLSAVEIASFELLLDRRIREVGATVVCAYRRSSFDQRTLTASLCVHPLDVADELPPFRLVAGPNAGWCLSGEVDLADADLFEAALGAAATRGERDIDVSDLLFIDTSGMRAMAREALGSPIRLSGARSIVRRSWQVSGFAEDVPTLEFLD
jgi:hypothetical protein